MPLRKLHVDGLTIAVDVEGAGRVIVLLHGIGSNRLSWGAVMSDLSQDNTVVAWDAPGYGESDDPAEGTFRLTDYAATLARVLDTLLGDVWPPEITLVGHSFGAMIALELYRRDPERIGRLILADATLGHGGKPDASEKRNGRLTAWRHSSAHEFASERVPRLLSPSAQKEVLVRGVDIMSTLHRVGYELAVHALYDESVEDVLPLVTAPTLILCGDHDVVTPVTLAQHIATSIPGAALSVIESAGHLSYLEQPDAFCRMVRKFVSSGEIRGGQSSGAFGNRQNRQLGH